MNKTALKLVIGLSIATAATAVIAIGVIRELNAIKALTISEDDLPEDLLKAGAFEDLDD